MSGIVWHSNHRRFHLSSIQNQTGIIKILKDAKVVLAVADRCRTHAFSKSNFAKWKAKYGGVEVSDIRRLYELEDLLEKNSKEDNIVIWLLAP
jgi:hypothetical protein